MANEVTGTENAAVIPETWNQEIVSALYDNNSLYPRVLNKSQNLSQFGDKVHIAVAPSFTVQSVGADGGVSVTAPTVTDITLTVATHEAILFEWLNSVKTQSYDAWWNSLPQEAGNALRESMEGTLLALGTGFTENTAVGSGNSHVDENMLTAMIGTLVRASLPILDRPMDNTWAFDGKEYEHMRRLGVLDWSRSGKTEGGPSNINMPLVYNIPLKFSNQVQSSSSVNQNLLFNRESMAAAVQEDIGLEFASGLANRKLTKIFSADVLYGVIEVDGNRAVRGLTTDA